MAKNTNEKIMTPEFRAAFANVLTPTKNQQGKEIYEITMLFPKNADISKLKKAEKDAATKTWGADRDKWPENVKSPFRDGDKKGYDGYEGHVFVRASSKFKPGIVDQNCEDIISAEEFYSGCYARATIRAFTYDQQGNRGVSFNLFNIQKLRDGEKFSGGGNAADDFEPVNSGSDNASNYGGPIGDDDDF